jgi:PBSX family phage terminase large subunit
MSATELQPPVGKQADSIREANARLNIWDGSVSSGKTVGSIMRWLIYCVEGPAGELAMIGKTTRTLKRNVLDPIESLIGKGLRVNRGAGEVYIFKRRVYLAYANDERAETRIRGLTLAGAYGDELTTWPESVFKMLLTRLRVPGAKLFATTNPDSPTHYLKRDYIDRVDELDLARFHFTLDDNPYLDQGYVEAVKAEFSGLWYERFILGHWVAAAGAVYDMLDLRPGGRNVFAEVDPSIIDRYLLAIDYGTSNPFVALLIGVGRDECIYVLREWRWDSTKARRQLTDAEYSRRLEEWVDGGCDGLLSHEGRPVSVPVSEVVIDPSAASMRRQLQRDGWGWAKKADNAVVDGIRDVSTLLSHGRLRIWAGCEDALRELSGYVWDPSAQEHGADAPVKADDHAPDALRYGIRELRHVWRHWLRRRRGGDEDDD